MSREDVETFLNELSQSNMAVELEDGLWMRAQVQRDGSPGRRQHSSSSKRTSASTADARQHGQFHCQTCTTVYLQLQVIEITPWTLDNCISRFINSLLRKKQHR